MENAIEEAMKEEKNAILDAAISTILTDVIFETEHVEEFHIATIKAICRKLILDMTKKEVRRVAELGIDENLHSFFISVIAEFNPELSDYLSTYSSAVSEELFYSIIPKDIITEITLDYNKADAVESILPDLNYYALSLMMESLETSEPDVNSTKEEIETVKYYCTGEGGELIDKELLNKLYEKENTDTD